MAIVQFLQRNARPLVYLGLLSASTWSFGATAVPQITQPVNNQQKVTLKGNVRPMPKRARDLGAVDVSTPASRVLLLLKRPAAQEAALRQFIADAHTAGSASYHHWLTPAQLGTQYGPSDSDVQAVLAWLQSQGFAVAKVSQAKTAIEFSGTAGQIQSAFNTRIHSFQLDGVAHISNVVDPQIPAALAPAIAGISPLNDFRPKPMHTAPGARLATPAPTSANPKAKTIRPTGAQPNLTVPNGSGGNSYYLTPADVATIYNTPNSALNKNHAGSLNLTGSGVSIGIAGDSNVDVTNVANYRSLFGLSAKVPTVVVDGNDPGTGSDDEVEALLDLEAASAIAPDANLTLYTADNTTFQAGLNLAIQRALDENAINILNVSFGACEAGEGQSGNQELLNFWEQAAAQGISVTVSTGDSGSAGCDNPNSEQQATAGLQVSGFASTPYNIAVGGTDFNQNAGNESTYWSATNSTIGESAKGPIPEIPWNDSTSTIGALVNNAPTTLQDGSNTIAAAGGGVSGCLNATFDPNTGALASCANANSSYTKPSWQSSFGTQNAREIPDVSLFAADGFHDSAWVICASGLGGNPTGTDCTPDAQGSFNFQTVGGTSASAPAFAGMLSLVVQQLQSGGATNVRLGQANYTLYPLSKQFPAAFHDVTTGNIAVVCAQASADCAANGFLTGYDATSGYDLATGLGSVDATQMVQNWSSITFKPTTTTLQLNGSSSSLSIAHGTSVSVTAAVTSSGGTPTGDIALVNSSSGTTPPVAAVQGTTPSPGVFTLTNGTISGSDAYLPGGTYTVNANYNGDGTFGASISNSINVTVSAEASVLSLNLLAFPASQNGSGFDINGITLPYGSYVSVYAQPLSSAQANCHVQQLQRCAQQSGGTQQQRLCRDSRTAGTCLCSRHLYSLCQLLRRSQLHREQGNVPDLHYQQGDHAGADGDEYSKRLAAGGGGPQQSGVLHEWRRCAA
jgi:trimeric autotransporter adhesin